MESSNDPEHDRFEIRRRIGGGVLGEVFEAYDRQRGEMVALKTLHRPRLAAIQKLQGEFKTLAAISHPNLVPLYEIHVGQESSFYTMELVEGASLKGYVYSSEETAEAPGETATLDGSRLRSALLQLALGVKAIHDAGKLHGDLKPSNLLVTPRGGLVILDFGVAAELIFSARSVESGFAGTAAYMAPEQARGEPPQPASDWYAVGVILFEVLTGRWPFVGSLARILIDKQFMTAPSPSDLRHGLSPDLVDLCRCLLETDPADRPTGAEIVQRLGGTDADLLTKPLGRSEGRFVGRQAHLAALDDAFALTQTGAAVSVSIHGSSGIGKTALVGAFLQRVRRRTQAVLLTGRCFPHEAAPFKALDGIVESLGRFLRHLGKNLVEELLPPRVDLLARLFPALLRLESVALAVEGSETQRWEGDGPDRLTLRRLAFEALRRLLSRLASIHPVILHVDDLQWSDADSVVLLRELLKTPDAPPILLLTTFRGEEVDTRPFLQELLAQTGNPKRRQLVVGKLTAQESQELARLHLGPMGETEAPVQRIVAEAQGSPFLIEQLSRSAPAEDPGTRMGVEVADLLRFQVERIGPSSRRLLRILAAAGKPLAWDLAGRAAQVGNERQHLESSLTAALLVRSFGGDERVELFHDRLRETLVAEMSDEEIRNVHARLASVLEEEGHEDPGTLMEHYARAGDHVRAGRLAQQAAARCSAALAFAHSARLYRMALEMGHVEEAERLGLLHDLADSLALAGKTREAAELHLELAGMTQGRQSQEYRRRSAMEYLRAGDVDRGLEITKGVLRSVGLEMPPDRRSSLTSLRWHRFHLWLRRYRYRREDAARIPARRLLRIDTCWAIASGLMTLDALQAADFQSRHLLLALEAGEERRVARALAMEVGIRSPAGSRVHRQTSGRRRRAHQLAGELGDAYAAALATLQDGIALFLGGGFRSALETCDRAEAMFGACYEGTVWEVTTARRFSLAALAHLGEIGEVSRRLPGCLREASEQGNTCGAYQLKTRLNVFWLAADDPDEARRQTDEAARTWVQGGFHLPHWDLVAARAEADLYTGHGVDALSAMEENLPALRKALLLGLQPVRAEAVLLTARSCLATALQDRSRRSELQLRARRGARQLDRESVPHARPLATLLRAAAAHLEGDSSGARDALERAAFGFESLEMRLHSTAAWRRLGELLGGTAGQELVHRSDAWMKQQNIRNPSRMTAMLTPGFSPETL